MQSLDNRHILEIDSVELSFGERQILTNVYLKVETGKITALLGSNGSGKSCLMRILFDQLKPRFKSIRIDSIWQNRLNNKQVLYLPQKCCIPQYMEVKKVFNDYNVSFDSFTSSFPEFKEYANKHIHELSGGEARIIEIYATLHAESQFIMLDEPFSHIMPLHIATIKSLIVQQKVFKGILMTDHMYRNVIDIADNIYVISNQTVYATKDQEDLVKYGYIKHLL